MAEEPRKDPRAKVFSMTVRYKSANIEEFITNHAEDTSLGGIFIKTASPFPVGTLLKFEIRIQGEKPVLGGIGRVLWKRDSDAASDASPAGMGVKFIKIDDATKLMLERLAEKRADRPNSYDAGRLEYEDESAEDLSVKICSNCGSKSPLSASKCWKCEHAFQSTSKTSNQGTMRGLGDVGAARKETVAQRKIREAFISLGTKLDLSGLALTELPVDLYRMEDTLEELSLAENPLANLDSAVRRLRKLRRLDISNTQISDFPGTLLGLPNLTQLVFRGCQLTTLPGFFKDLRALEQLDISGNRIESLPAEMALLRLRALDISNNPLSGNVDAIWKISTLESLRANDTKLSAISSNIINLTKLHGLWLSRNEISALPSTITELENIKQLDLRGNPLSIPPEILERTQDPQAIFMAYFSANPRRLNEAKLLVLGQGSVGKTSLVNRLVSNTFDPHEDPTHGIQRHRWRVRANGEDVRINIWDFGGQEIMHATHQFFLTQRSIYVIVVDSRVDEQENRIEYWLKLVQSFGGNSPVIIVSNKADHQHLELAERRLSDKYKNIAGFFPLSAKTGDGIPKLVEAIEAIVARLPHVRDTVPEPWFLLKRDLEGTSKNYLPLEEFDALCQTRKIEKVAEQRTLLRLLHDLGTILSFIDDPRLQDTNVLSPAWVTTGVYSILTWSELYAAKGVLDVSRLDERLDRTMYPAKTHLFLIDMMRKFELCFPLQTADKIEQYLIPTLLPKDEPDTGSWDGALAFEYHYDILPDSVISRFIVKMHHCISKRTYWRSGAVLANDSCRAFVRADTTDGVVEIRVTGENEMARRLFLGEIQGQFAAVHAPLSGLRVASKVVVLVDGRRVVIDYQDLLTHEEQGIETILAPGTKHRLVVRELLNGYRATNPTERQTDTLPPQVQKERSPWSTGLFYLFAFVVILGVTAAAGRYIPWVAVPAVFLASAIMVGIIGAIQLRHDDRLKEEGFLSLMKESYRQLPLFRDRSASEQGSAEMIKKE